MMNRANIVGWLVDAPAYYADRKPEMAKFTLSVPRDVPADAEGKRAADFIDCICFRQQAKIIDDGMLQRGDKLAVDGRVQTRVWRDEKHDITRKGWEIVVDKVYFL